MTNEEKIKTLSTVSMENFIRRLFMCNCCAYKRHCTEYTDCHKGIVEWLKQEADDGVWQKLLGEGS